MNTDLKIVSEISTGIIQTPSESTNHVRFYFKNTHSSIQVLIQALKPVVMFASLLFLCTGGSLDQRSGRRRRKRAGGCTPRPHPEHTLHVCTLQTKGEPPRPGPASHTRGRGVGWGGWSLHSSGLGNSNASRHLAPQGNHLFVLFLLPTTTLLVSTCHHWP